jgi:hypothetical protein
MHSIRRFVCEVGVSLVYCAAAAERPLRKPWVKRSIVPSGLSAGTSRKLPIWHGIQPRMSSQALTRLVASGSRCNCHKHRSVAAAHDHSVRIAKGYYGIGALGQSSVRRLSAKGS